ncbi:hypothetical protein CYJ37_11930 [Bacillus sp. UMB0728]|nr:hypothetical protein CYJ37_11930 [Bacillus sp. UMB0728]
MSDSPRNIHFILKGEVSNLNIYDYYLEEIKKESLMLAEKVSQGIYTVDESLELLDQKRKKLGEEIENGLVQTK